MSVRVSWEWPDGSGGYTDAADTDDALLEASWISLQCRVWIGDEVVQQGWKDNDDQGEP